MESFEGVPVSPGIAIGEVFLFETRRQSLPDRRIAAADVTSEIGRLEEAVVAAQAEIEDLKRRAGLPDDIAAIFSTHDMLLTDATLRVEIEKSIRERLVPAENAVAFVFDTLVAKFKSLGEDYFATGINPFDYAAFGGEECFQGKAATRRTVGLIMRMLSEGYRGPMI